MNSFENLFFSFLNKSNQEHNAKVAKYALNLYNKINGTSFKSAAPKIIVLKVNTRKNKKATA